MSIDVLLGDAPSASSDVADRVVIVIDVLRAATSVAVALCNGASEVRPFLTVEETMFAAESLARSIGRSALCLAGERHAVRISGFDLGNSPLEMTRAIVEGKTMLFSTTNGTAALLATRGATASYLASFVNCAATVRAALSTFVECANATGFTIVCAGHEGVLALEDVVCAGRLVRGLSASRTVMPLSDRARVAVAVEAPFVQSLAALATAASHARTLSIGGFASDVEFCLTTDSVPVAVRFRGGALAIDDGATGQDAANESREDMLHVGNVHNVAAPVIVAVGSR